MPLYDFACPKCGARTSEFRRLADYAKPMPCGACGCAFMRHDLVAQQPAIRGNYKKPIHLESMGFIADAADVAEHRKRFPDVELKMAQGSAIPVVRSLGQKRAYLKASGWVDTRSF